MQLSRTSVLAIASLALGQPALAQGMYARLHVSSGMIWTDNSGIPYTGALALALAWSLGDTLLRREQNVMLGPVAGARFARLPGPPSNFEGFLGARASGRILRTVAPLDLLWALDASVGTRGRVPLGVSLGPGLRQSWAALARFAYDVKHGEPTLELVVTAPLSFGGVPAACRPQDWDVRASYLERVKLEAYTDPLFRTVDTTTRLPAQLPPSVSDRSGFAAFLAGTIPAAVLARPHLDNLVTQARPPAGENWDKRETWAAVLVGWSEQLRIRRCRGP